MGHFLMHPMAVFAARHSYSAIAAGAVARCVYVCSYYSLLLDNSRQLRNTLEDGDTVIKNIYTLRGAKCTDAKFDPPAAKPARLTGARVCSVMLAPKCST